MTEKIGKKKKKEALSSVLIIAKDLLTFAHFFSEESAEKFPN